MRDYFSHIYISSLLKNNSSTMSSLRYFKRCSITGTKVKWAVLFMGTTAILNEQSSVWNKSNSNRSCGQSELALIMLGIICGSRNTHLMEKFVLCEMLQVYTWNQSQVSRLLHGHNDNSVHKSNFQPLFQPELIGTIFFVFVLGRNWMNGFCFVKYGNY